MKKKYVVVVSSTVQVTVKGTLKNAAGKPEPFKFTLTCDRVDADDLKARLENSFNAKEFMAEVTTGWEGQRLVLEEDGKTPADFEPDAMDQLLKIPGMAMLCFVAYSKDAVAEGKN